MIKRIPGEVWKQLSFEGSKELRNRYAVSSMGRLASYRDDVMEDGKLLNGSLTTGYRTLNLHRPERKSTLYLHREIARLFMKRPSVKHKYVIHKNHNKLDNRASNLRWATLEEMIMHQQKSPAKIAYKQKQAERVVGLKLTATQVRRIKDMLNNKNRRLTIKQIAEKYDVSEMTMYRIKSGENWGRV
ncbi:MAG TPA: NUMOD4 domain-containing protein [Flavisolibacter sp.]|nr:NUMOD4 domain-containing protein [Flavisolibacter sp.]